MEFIDLKKQYKIIENGLRPRLDEVFAQCNFIQGAQVGELEAKLSEFVGVKHTIACANGTDALMIAMLGLDLQPGDEIITTDFSFVAIVEMAMLIGVKPVLVDIDKDTFNIDLDLIESKITSKTKAIIPVDLYGLCVNYDKLGELAKKHGLKVIEDAGQSFGSSFNGRKSCSFGDAAITSFFPSKPLGCYGDGGAIFTNDDELATKFRMLANHGAKLRYTHEIVGMNSRLDTIQAVVLLEKLKIFESELRQREYVAGIYENYLSELIEQQKISLQVFPKDALYFSNYAQFTMLVYYERAEFISRMNGAGVPTAVHYPSTLSGQEICKKFGYSNSDSPNAYFASKHVVSLPMHPYLEDADVKFITDTVKLILGQD